MVVGVNLGIVLELHTKIFYTKENEMKDYSHNYNVRDASGRFTKKGSTTAPAVKTVCQPPTNRKDEYLSTLRTHEVLVTHERNGQSVVDNLTLKADYLTGYVGKGNSKKAPSDLIYAYDIDEKRFKAIDVTKISSFIPL